MPQLSFLPDPELPSKPGIDLRCCDIADLLPVVSGAAVVHADPPWIYRNAGNAGNAADQYALLSMEQIAEHVERSYHAAAPDAYLLCWATFPKLAEWMPHLERTSWRYVTGGAWFKTGGLGIGYHFRGDVEPLLVCTKGKPRPVLAVSSAYAGPRAAHSEKPMPWLEQLVQSFTEPGATVLDLYAGLGPMARACYRTDRKYIGAEIDAQRHRQALGRLAQERVK
jgi:N6-adenosine-specific RNA methylase IME4